MQRYPLGIWAGIIFSLTLSASALYWDESRVVLGPDSSWATPATLDAEYREAQERLVLPEGQRWPAALPYPATSPDGVKNNYGKGLGAEWAEWYWFDAWTAVAVSSAESTATRRAAIELLPQYYETRAFSTSADPDYYRNIITTAQNGDTTALREYVDLVEELARDEDETRD